MGLYVFLAVLVGIAGVVLYVRHKIRRFSKSVFGNADIVEALKAVDVEGRDVPRNLNGCDQLLMPTILKDFPDFDVNLAKTYVRETLQERFPGIQIHNVVISQYLRSGAQRTIVFQAGCRLENSDTKEKRFELHYTYLLPSADKSVAANCPNCGGALGFGQTVCPYCGSRVANVLGNTWRFTEVRET